MAGKGDTRRPSSLSQQEWEVRWATAFGKAARSPQEPSDYEMPYWVPLHNFGGPELHSGVARETCHNNTPVVAPTTPKREAK